MKRPHDPLDAQRPLDQSSPASQELTLSVDLKMATEQQLGLASLREPSADALRPTPMPTPSAEARVAPLAARSIPRVDSQSIPPATAIVDAKPIIDVIDKADVIPAAAISTAAPLAYEPGPGVIVTDATIGLPPTPKVDILDDPADAVIDAELLPIEEGSGMIEIVEPFVIDEGNS